MLIPRSLIAALLLTAALLFTGLSTQHSAVGAVSVIGGSDGPTSVYITDTTP